LSLGVLAARAQLAISRPALPRGRWTAAHIAAELGELLVRQNDRKITIFQSLGLAVEDIFAIYLALTRGGRP
jgi:ornithine cyclodeaminase/alanine dehydrogenase-like protein (mu-crystallin family)